MGRGATDAEPYALVYGINSKGKAARKFDAYVTEFSRRTGLKVIRVCTGYAHIITHLFRNETLLFLPEVFDFISLIDNARYVLTDSFHGTAFSLNLNTEPICVIPEMFGGRLESILRLTGTLDRKIRSWDDFDIISRPVDWHNVNSILDAERLKVSRWLAGVLGEIAAEKQK